MRWPSKFGLITVLLLGGLNTVQQAHGQSTYSVVLRDVSLVEALEHFVDLTGNPIAYDPRLVADAGRVFCVTRTDQSEELLACILRETTLDFFRLSSGTYSLMPRAEKRPMFGRLAGGVIDQESGTPIAYAHVAIEENGAGTASNLAGQFVLPPLLPGSYTLRVTHVNYGTIVQDVTVRPDGRDYVSIPMHARPVFVAPVIIDGAAQRIRSESTEASRTLGPPNFQAGTVRLNRRLLSVPGVRVNDVTADLHIQAGEPGEHQFRLDGVPIFVPRHILGLYGAFSPFALGSLTVHRAGFDADVGSQIAGIVDARHLLGSNRPLDVQADPMSLNARIEFDVGRSGSRDVVTSIAARVRNNHAWTPPWIANYLSSWSRPDEFLMAAPIRYYSADPQSMTPALSFERVPSPEFTFNDLHFASRMRLTPMSTIYFSGYRGEQRLGGRLAHRDALIPQHEGGSWISVDDEYFWSNAALQGTYNAVLNSRSLFSFQLRFSDYSHRYRHLLMENLLVTMGTLGGRTASFSAYPARDKNYVQELAAKATVDHITGIHNLEGGLEVTRTSSGFDFYISDTPQMLDLQTGDSQQFSVRRVMVDHAYEAWRVASFAQNRISLGDRMNLTLGLRLTYLPETGVAYAEPRAALTLGGEGGAPGGWSLSTRAGIFRQFVTQHDVSSLDAGALLPTLRIWLPVDGSVRPPMAYHLAQGVTIRPTSRLELVADVYGRIQPHALMIDYSVAGRLDQSLHVFRQDEMMVASELAAVGGSFLTAFDLGWLDLRGGYDYSFVRRRSREVFDGRWETVPWNEPHRLHLAADVLAGGRTAVGLRWQTSIGRSWAFRQAYYDYFAPRPEFSMLTSVDLSRPSDHVLPPRHQIDLTAAYTLPVGGAHLQARIEILNVLNHRNVDEWRLVESAEAFVTAPHASYGRLPSAAVRLTW